MNIWQKNIFKATRQASATKTIFKATDTKKDFKTTEAKKHFLTDMRQKNFQRHKRKKLFRNDKSQQVISEATSVKKFKETSGNFCLTPHYTLAWAAARIHDTEGRQTKIPEPEFVIFRGWSNKNPRARIRHFQAEGSNKNPRVEKISK